MAQDTEGMAQRTARAMPARTADSGEGGSQPSLTVILSLTDVAKATGARTGATGVMAPTAATARRLAQWAGQE